MRRRNLEFSNRSFGDKRQTHRNYKRPAKCWKQDILFFLRRPSNIHYFLFNSTQREDMLRGCGVDLNGDLPQPEIVARDLIYLVAASGIILAQLRSHRPAQKLWAAEVLTCFAQERAMKTVPGQERFIYERLQHSGRAFINGNCPITDLRRAIEATRFDFYPQPVEGYRIAS